MTTTNLGTKSMNVGRWLIWSLFAVVLLIAPLVFSGGFGTTVLSQMGIAIIACLSYNMLLGQGGMLKKVAILKLGQFYPADGTAINVGRADADEEMTVKPSVVRF